MATSKIGKGTVLADNEEEQYKSPYEVALESGKDIAAPTPTTDAPSATTEDDGYDDTEVVSTREPAKLNNWYETLFRQDNAGEAADISDEQRQRMARRERAERVIAGLGDIGTHIANIALAGRGATPAKPTTTMSENLDKAWSRYNQDFETRRKEYRQGLNNARKLDYQRFLDDRKQQLAYDREDRLRLQQQAQNDYRQDLLELRQAEWEFKKAQLEAKAPKELALLEARVESLKEQAALSKARAEGRVSYGRGGRSTSKATNGEPTKSELIDEYTALGGTINKGRNGLPMNPTADQLKIGIRNLRQQQHLPPADWDKPKKDYTGGASTENNDYSQYKVTPNTK